VTREEVVAQVNEILIQGFEVDPDLLRPEAHLGKDLELDSLDAVDLVVALEKKFGCRIEESEARAMRTLQDIYGYIEQRAARERSTR
jgi:acyl carrier protein